MMGDLLSAASLILAAIAFLYTAWQPGIQEARNFKTERHYPDAENDHEQLKDAIWQRAVPLTIATTIIAIIFLPETCRILRFSWNNVLEKGVREALRDYDVLATTLIVVNSAFFVLAAHLGATVKELYRKHQKFEEKRLAYEASKPAS